jgi:hypothetical protein
MFALPAPVATLSAPPQAESGFTPLFDGRSLAGWTESGGRYDGDADWRVEHGCIVGRQGPNGEGGLLYTEKEYSSFELRLEVQLDQPFDSGVFVRMVPPERNQKGAQVTLDWREGGEIGAIYADGYLQHNETGALRFRKDEWNELRVRCTGFDMRIRAELNGQILTDFRHEPANPHEFAPSGRIGLQVHGARGDPGAARFRNIRLLELPQFDELLWTSIHEASSGLRSLSPDAQQRGWRPLFDRTSLAGWQVEGPADRFRIADGVLSFLARGGGGHLYTQEDFQDFELSLDFQIARMANSGLFLRAARDGSNPAFSGCELQILDDFNWESVTGTKLKPWQFTGSLYGAVPSPQRDALHPLGEWNSYEVHCKGTRLAVALNGRTLYDVDTQALVPEQGAPFGQRAPTGFIGLQHHGAETVSDEPMVSFRNLFVRRL